MAQIEESFRSLPSPDRASRAGAKRIQDAFDGSVWKAQTQFPGVYSSVGPGLAAFNNSLTWRKGTNADHRIWLSQLNGVSSTAQQGGSNVGTSLDLIEAEQAV